MTSILVVISGNSMWPTYHDGDKVEFTKYDSDDLKVGDIVVAMHPFKKDTKLVKRIVKINEDSTYILQGDNPDPTASEDSHNFGPVNGSSIVAYIEC